MSKNRGWASCLETKQRLQSSKFLEGKVEAKYSASAVRTLQTALKNLIAFTQTYQKGLNKEQNLHLKNVSITIALPSHFSEKTNTSVAFAKRNAMLRRGFRWRKVQEFQSLQSCVLITKARKLMRRCSSLHDFHSKNLQVSQSIGLPRVSPRQTTKVYIRIVNCAEKVTKQP